MEWSRRQIEILQAASELINEAGIQHLTIKNLSLKIGISEPALYRHFESKVEILSCVLRYFRELLKEEIQEIIDSGRTGIEKVKGIVTYQFSYFSQNPSVVMTIFSETSFQNDDRLSKEVYAIIRSKNEMMCKVILEGQEDGSIRNDILDKELATMVLGSMRFTVLKWRLSDFGFDLKKEGEVLSRSISKLLNPV